MIEFRFWVLRHELSRVKALLLGSKDSEEQSCVVVLIECYSDRPESPILIL